ncbi:hypothetical protein ACKQTC_03500 [Peptococcus simiae]|uniref:Copper amine oxidase N-terminal domain-containing protein n=1 Tax=Peptococcus simiae TaxID=1643805 RepID=A0ABW9GXS9_9FIRM
MFKKTQFILVGLACLLALAAGAPALAQDNPAPATANAKVPADKQVVQPAPTDSQVIVNGQALSPGDQAAGISLVDNTTMISDRLLPRLHFSAIRDGHAVTVTSLTGTTSQWTLDQTTYMVNQNPAQAPAAPYEDGPYVYLPLRALVETVGTVNWSPDSRSITILTPTKVLKPDKTLSVTGPTPALKAEAPQVDKVIDRLADGSLLTGDAQLNSGGYSKLYHRGRVILTGKNKLGVLTNPTLIPTADRLVWQETASTDSPGGMPFNLYEAPLANPGQARLIADQLYPDIDKLAANENWIVYTTGLKDKPGASAQLRAYNRKTGDYQVLDTLKDPHRYYLDVQLDQDRVVWTIGQGGLSESMVLCDLTKPGSAKMISEGYAFRDPVLKDNQLVASREMRTLKGRTEEVWHYDLDAGRWTWRLDPTLDLLPQSKSFFIQKVLFSDHYLALFPVDRTGDDQAFTRLSVLDLKTGTLAPLALNEGALPLINASKDRPNTRRISAIRPGADGSLHLQTYAQENSQADSLFISIA